MAEKKKPETAPVQPTNFSDLVSEDKKPFLRKWIDIIARIVLAASILTALTPSVVDNAHLQKVMDFLNVLALNVGLNVNHDKMKAAQDAADGLVTDAQ